MAYQTEAEIRVGTSAITAAEWEGVFYPAGMQPRDFLTYYATHFNTVEVDGTFYRTPARSTIAGSANKTPPGFVFALKVPQVISHEKCLEDCGDDFQNFADTAEGLGKDKLGPMLLQFPYLNRTKFKTGAEFLARLRPFLKKLPKDHQFALEIRNKNWLDKKCTEILREHNVALAVTDQAWMPGITELTSRLDPITADFTYIRWLGDRRGIEEQTKVWDELSWTAAPPFHAGWTTVTKPRAAASKFTPMRTTTTPALRPRPSRCSGTFGKSRKRNPDAACVCGRNFSKMVKA